MLILEGNIILVILTMDEIDPINETLRDSVLGSVRDSLKEKSSIDSYYDMLCDKNKIKTLANDGQQPFMKILSKHFKVIYIKEEMNFFQNEYLINFIYK